MDRNKQLSHLSLCSGYDGIGLGLEKAGLDIGFTVHVEVEAFAAKNLVNKIEAGALGAGAHFPDLKKFPYAKFRGCFDILSGGFPCQPFSQAGKGHGDEDPRHLFPYIKDGISECQPNIVFLENVDGIASAKLKGDHWNDPAGTPVLLHVLRELERVGYRCTAVPSSASEVGAPHQRNRWFIIGLANDQRERVEELAGEIATEAKHGAARHRGPAWPSRPGEPQFGWEPPRVVDHPESQRRQDSGKEPGCPPQRSNGMEDGIGIGHCRRPSECGGSQEEREYNKVAVSGGGGSDRTPFGKETQPSVGRDADGPSGGLDYAELCVSADNRTDELRLLGNGVVPESARDAFLRGIRELLNKGTNEK